ncbi:MAG: hypothetical protein NTU49_00540 [Gammaproteobacteria bacterium]|nr:hypothetical protein [Gammaproteobacteria bacterium]
MRLLDADANKNDNLKLLHKEILDQLHSQVASVNMESFIVRPHRLYVEKYIERESWDNLKPNDYHDISKHLSDLPSPDSDDEFSRRFDLLCLNLAISFIEISKRQEGYKESIIDIARGLEKKKNIPAVACKIDFIRIIQTEDYWENITIPAIERLRKELRELIKFIDTDTGLTRVYTNFEDEFGDAIEVKEFIPSGGDRENYRLKVERFVREHKDHITIRRLMYNQPVTSNDIQGFEEILFSEQGVGNSREQFEKTFGNQSFGQFIRSIVGLDREAAKEIFSEFLASKKLSADQITFVNQIVEHLVKNGMMNPEKLFEQPFTDFHSEGVVGVFPNDAERILKVIEDVNSKADAA